MAAIQSVVGYWLWISAVEGIHPLKDSWRRFGALMWIVPVMLLIIVTYNQILFTLQIPDPFDESLRLYDSWRLKDPAEASDPQSPPRVTILGSGSDFAPFIQQAGVAVTDHRYYLDRVSGRYKSSKLHRKDTSGN